MFLYTLKQYKSDTSCSNIKNDEDGNRTIPFYNVYIRNHNIV